MLRQSGSFYCSWRQNLDPLNLCISQTKNCKFRKFFGDDKYFMGIFCLRLNSFLLFTRKKHKKFRSLSPSGWWIVTSAEHITAVLHQTFEQSHLFGMSFVRNKEIGESQFQAAAGAAFWWQTFNLIKKTFCLDIVDKTTNGDKRKACLKNRNGNANLSCNEVVSGPGTFDAFLRPIFLESFCTQMS